jgi:hypothetical protein
MVRMCSAGNNDKENVSMCWRQTQLFCKYFWFAVGWILTCGTCGYGGWLHQLLQTMVTTEVLTTHLYLSIHMLHLWSRVSIFPVWTRSQEDCLGIWWRQGLEYFVQASLALWSSKLYLLSSWDYSCVPPYLAWNMVLLTLFCLGWPQTLILQSPPFK